MTRIVISQIYLEIIHFSVRAPWTARRSNQSILKEISLECSLEGLMLKLKLQYFGHDQDNHNGVITDLEPDILECEVK